MTSPNEAEMLKWIEEASLEDLLRKWRKEPAGSPWFAGGEVTRTYTMRMAKLREENPAEWVAASKRVGWG